MSWWNPFNWGKKKKSSLDVNNLVAVHVPKLSMDKKSLHDTVHRITKIVLAHSTEFEDWKSHSVMIFQTFFEDVSYMYGLYNGLSKHPVDVFKINVKSLSTLCRQQEKKITNFEKELYHWEMYLKHNGKNVVWIKRCRSDFVVLHHLVKEMYDNCVRLS